MAVHVIATAVYILFVVNVFVTCRQITAAAKRRMRVHEVRSQWGGGGKYYIPYKQTDQQTNSFGAVGDKSC